MTDGIRTTALLVMVVDSDVPFSDSLSPKDDVRVGH